MTRGIIDWLSVYIGKERPLYWSSNISSSKQFTFGIVIKVLLDNLVILWWIVAYSYTEIVIFLETNLQLKTAVLHLCCVSCFHGGDSCWIVFCVWCGRFVSRMRNWIISSASFVVIDNRSIWFSSARVEPSTIFPDCFRGDCSGC